MCQRFHENYFVVVLNHRATGACPLALVISCLPCCHLWLFVVISFAAFWTNDHRLRQRCRGRRSVVGRRSIFSRLGELAIKIAKEGGREGRNERERERARTRCIPTSTHASYAARPNKACICSRAMRNSSSALYLTTYTLADPALESS